MVRRLGDDREKDIRAGIFHVSMLAGGTAADDGGRECPHCGYVSYNDEIDKDEPPDVCPECGRDLP